MLRMLFAIAFALAVSAGCASNAPQQLRPAPRAIASADAPGAVHAADEGVQLVAQVNAWPGDPAVARESIPIRVWIRNQSPEALRIRYDDLMLVAADGSHYAVLPPVGPDHLTSEQGVRRVVRDPEFQQSGFSVAPYLAYAYPSLQVYGGEFDYETGYFRRYREASEKRVRRDPLALTLGIPEGVLQSGGEIRGFLFFERVEPGDAEKGLIRLHADLETAEAEDLAVLSIPFAMEDE